MIKTYMKTAADIVSAYVSHNSVRSEDVLGLIKDVHARITELADGSPVESDKPQPHMPWKKTIHADYLISLEDGKRYQTLKRHLTTRGMTIPQYREKWGLPDDYPTTARSYSEKRSALAHTNRLGLKSAETQTHPAAETATPPVPKRGQAHPKSLQTRKRNSKNDEDSEA